MDLQVGRRREPKQVIKVPPIAKRGCELSPNGHYRYQLFRGFKGGEELGRAVFCMLNPSTATDWIDDQTVRKCLGYTFLWGKGSLVVINLFAFRSRHPLNLLHEEDPNGPHNDGTISAVLARHEASRDLLVCAWGASGNKTLRKRIEQRSLELWPTLAGHEPQCLGLAKDGSPRHPLMTSYKIEPTPYALP